MRTVGRAIYASPVRKNYKTACQLAELFDSPSR